MQLFIHKFVEIAFIILFIFRSNKAIAQLAFNLYAMGNQIQLLHNKTKQQMFMNINPTLVGNVYSILALSMVVPICFFFRQYFRGLEFVQMAFFFYKVMGLSIATYSSSLNTSCTNFGYSFLTFCTAGDVVCSNGFQLSFAITLAGLLLLLLIIFSMQKCRRPDTKYEPIYCALKGFIKWIYLPLTFSSVVFLIRSIINSLDAKSYLLPSAVIVGILAIFPVCQLIGYTMIQTEGTPIWIKWVEFFDYCRLQVVGTLLALGFAYSNNIYYDYIIIPLALYAIIFVWKGSFKYPIAERIIAVLGQGAFITVFLFFRYKNAFIQIYDLDFFLLGGVLLMDTILYLVRASQLSCYGTNQEVAEVNPEFTVELPNNRKSIEVPEVREVRKPVNYQMKKVNKYQQDSVEELAASRESLNASKPLAKKRR